MCHGCVWLLQTACVWQHSGRVILHTLDTRHPCSVRLIMCSYYTTPSSVCTQTHCSISVKKNIYVSEINYSLSHCNNMQPITFFWSYFDMTCFWVNKQYSNTIIQISITCGNFVMNLKSHAKSLDYDVLTPIHDHDWSVNLPSGSHQGRLLLDPFNINYTVI